MGSSLSQFNVEVTFANWPRTVLTIMCLTANVAVVWAGSLSRSIVAAKAGAAKSSAARAIFMSRSPLDFQAICQSLTTEAGSYPEAR